MIFTTINAVAYRVHDPKWAYAPTSGTGAGRHGGRANRPGVNAIYLSLELETALAEYQQIDGLLPPASMVSYRVAVDKVVDFSGGYTAEWDPLWQDFYCDWRKLVFHEDIEPPSWVIGDRVLALGAKGILFNSVITGGVNLVLYNDAMVAPDLIVPHDPHRSLPKNQNSWN